MHKTFLVNIFAGTVHCVQNRSKIAIWSSIFCTLAISWSIIAEIWSHRKGQHKRQFIHLENGIIVVHKNGGKQMIYSYLLTKNTIILQPITFLEIQGPVFQDFLRLEIPTCGRKSNKGYFWMFSSKCGDFTKWSHNKKFDPSSIAETQNLPFGVKILMLETLESCQAVI